ncbi:spondin-1-like [Achroia grisella]|uniref:spondin-1-like n=1 Tax=Achroia grisella TaxID=688607 RepID=UPI0027D32E41|nr:spondin-1-like [Achroia grisella]
MEIRFQMAAILFLSITSIVFVYGCDIDDVAIYRVKVNFLWSEERFPKDYPMNRPKAQWSPIFGQSHNNSYTLYRLKEVARTSIRNFAQYSNIDDLVKEGEDEPKVYDQFSAPAIGFGVGETSNVVLVDGAHSFVSLISRIIPSPDWFIGVDSMDMCVDSTWIEEITLDLYPLDAGAASGLTFTAPRWETSPPEPVTKHEPRTPNHPAAGFYYPELKELPAIAKVEFIKINEYSTKELNELLRKDLLAKLKQKDDYKGYPKSKLINTKIDKEEVTTKSQMDVLTDLEEEPLGTPRPNLAQNFVIIVKEDPKEISEDEFGDDLQNMDDVVKAVAHGRKLGLKKHLPRHFRSRLNHAINRIQPNDCLVSDWSDWTPCSVTCGFGDKFRSRTVLRNKTENGRECPLLEERTHCGNINSCVKIDYFDW